MAVRGDRNSTDIEARKLSCSCQLLELCVGLLEALRVVGQRPLQSLTHGDITHQPGEDPPVRQPYFADRQVDGKRGPVLTQSRSLPSDADHLSLAGGHVVGQVGVMVAVEGSGINILMFCSSTSDGS